MSENHKKNNLFSEFPQVTTQQWEEKIIADLKGADYEKSLVWKTLEGFKVKPYYRAEDLQTFKYIDAKPAEFPFVRGSKTISNEWEIRENISVVSIEEANKLALDALSKGATSLNFVIEDESIKRTVNSQADFSALLKGIAFDCIELNFSGYQITEDFTKYIKAEAKVRGFSKSQLRGSFRKDPLGQLISSGRTSGEAIEQVIDELAYQVRNVHEVLPGFRIVSVNGQYYGNNGATVVQELAFTLAQANEYLARFTADNIKIDELAPRMELQFSVSGNYFMEIAKIRAARMLWAIITDKYKVECNDSKVIYISSVTTKWNKTAYDPYVNMLRATTEAMSAILGGTDSLIVHPFNANFNKPNEFSRRIARNIQNILKEEAYLDKIVDPAAGSYYIENL
ncbi:MAG TPA: methylmalonyl-CoA mutase small subunit, partial [Bacteroidales bacterium]|nr:methylmalonyl-CoA mutase small subunit [Bacteroidales bacterium]